MKTSDKRDAHTRQLYQRKLVCVLVHTAHIYIISFQILVLTTILIHTSESLDVLDKNNLLKNKKHEEVVIADYCPKMPHCKDGEHVLCMSNPVSKYNY